MTITKKLSTLIVTVQNKPGVLYRISGLIRKRRFNITSLTVAQTGDPLTSRFTIMVEGDKETVEKMCKQLYRVIEVLKVNDPEEVEIVARELALIKVSTSKSGSKMEIAMIADNFRAKVINIQPDSMMLELTGDEEKIDAFYENMKKYGIMEFVRTGRTVLFK